ncbi:MAG: O-methyltransferase [Saprospiraceae bacterium]|nr:O-methyltransferase [Saprospiraceae bacterium]
MEQIITNPAIEQYIDQQKSPADALLLSVERATHLKAMSPQMLSGQTQGNFLSIIALMMRPRRVLEIGTYTGFSALCMAEGLASDGLIYTLEANPEIAPMAQEHFSMSRYSDKIVFKIGDAREIIPSLDETWDLVFIDADKTSYCDYYDMVIDRLRPGGIILADNVLWYGKVLENKMDKKTKVLHEFNKKLANDARVKCVILPLRDGINMAIKL